MEHPSSLKDIWYVVVTLLSRLSHFSVREVKERISGNLVNGHLNQLMTCLLQLSISLMG